MSEAIPENNPVTFVRLDGEDGDISDIIIKRNDTVHHYIKDTFADDVTFKNISDALLFLFNKHQVAADNNSALKARIKELEWKPMCDAKPQWHENYDLWVVDFDYITGEIICSWRACNCRWDPESKIWMYVDSEKVIDTSTDTRVTHIRLITSPHNSEGGK